MKNTDINFDIAKRVRKSIFIDREGDWTSFTNGMGSMAVYLGAYIPNFLVFIEIYNLDGNLILNYPVEHCTEAELEEAMKRQVLLYGKLIKNVGVSTVAVETSLVESAEWFALERFKAPEFLVVEALERAEKLAKPVNEQLSYLDLIVEVENREAGIEEVSSLVQETPRPVLCENPGEFQTIALPVIMRAKFVRIKSADDKGVGEVDAADSAATSNDTPEPSGNDNPVPIPVRDDYLTAAKDSLGSHPRVWSMMRDITAIIYSLLSWAMLIISIRAIRK